MLIYRIIKSTQYKGVVCDKYIPLFCVNLIHHLKNRDLYPLFFPGAKKNHLSVVLLKVHENVPLKAQSH